MTSKEGIVLAQFEISKGKKTPSCSRPIRSKTGDNKGKESKSNRSVEIRVFTILDLLLLHKGFQSCSCADLWQKSRYLANFTKDTILISAIAWVRG